MKIEIVKQSILPKKLAITSAEKIATAMPCLPRVLKLLIKVQFKI